MPRRSFDSAALYDALIAKERVLTHTQLRELGLATSTISRRIGPKAPWQRLLPGVVLAHRGTPTRREIQLGALAFAGEGSIITGVDALRAAGGRTRYPSTVHVLTPIERQRSSFSYVRVERTRRMPAPISRGDIPFAPVARATVDACRHLESLSAVRELAASVIQESMCELPELAAEVRRAARQRTALVRSVLTEVADGVRSVAEARAREILIRLDAPLPEWNATLLDADGNPFLTPDAFWPDFSAAMEIDSRAWHLRPEDWNRTRRRQRRLTIGRITVIGFSPMEIIEDPDEFAHDVVAFLDSVGRRPMPAGLSFRRAA